MADDWGAPQQEEQDFEFDGGEFTRDDISGGDTVDKEGWYHFEVVNVKNDFETLNDKGRERSPCVVLTCNVLNNVKGQSAPGSKYFHRIYVASKGGGEAADGAKKSAMRFGVGLGIFKFIEKDGREIIVDAATGETKLKASAWQRAMGRQFVAKIVKEASDDPKFPDKYVVPFGRNYHPHDEAVSEVPKNQEALAMLGNPPLPKAPPANPNSGAEKQATKRPAAPAKPAQPPAGADDEFADL